MSMKVRTMLTGTLQEIGRDKSESHQTLRTAVNYCGLVQVLEVARPTLFTNVAPLSFADTANLGLGWACGEVGLLWSATGVAVTNETLAQKTVKAEARRTAGMVTTRKQDQRFVVSDIALYTQGRPKTYQCMRPVEEI